MALSIDTQILGQETTSTTTYCYLYEPLRVVFSESDLTAKKLYITLEVVDTTDSSNVIETLDDYGDYDINSGTAISIDLMKLAQQHHDADVFHISNVDDIVSGWQSVVSKYKYNFLIYTDVEETPIVISKLPIIGARTFETFTPTVTTATPLSEFALHNIDLTDRWQEHSFINQSLASASATDSTPTITKSVSNTNGNYPCGGYIYWKSRFGGWCSWGFDISTSSDSHRYNGSLDSGMFESTQEIGGNPYVQTDYTSVSTTYTKTLKALSLNADELMAVHGINSTTAVYRVINDSGDLELMRLSSATAPISSLANGGDFSVSLKGISTTSINTK